MSGDRHLREEHGLGAAVAIAVLGFAALFAGAVARPAPAFAALVAACAFLASLAAGAAILSPLCSDLFGGRDARLERACARLTAPVPILLVLLVPILAGAGALYPWASPPPRVAPAADLFARDPLLLACCLGVFGAQLLAGGALGAAALVALVSGGSGAAPARPGRFAGTLGGLMLFWVYFAILEGAVLLAGGSTAGGQSANTLFVLVLVHLGLFALLLVTPLRRERLWLVATSAAVLLMQYVALSSVALPARRAHGASLWLDVAALAAVGGMSAAYALWRTPRASATLRAGA